MDPKSLIVFGVVGITLLGAIASGVALVVFANRALSAGFGEKAARVRELARQEGVVFVEDGVASFTRWTRAGAAALRWPRVDVLVTPVAVYMMQHEKMLGFRMNQPILAYAPNGGLSTLMHALVTPLELDGPPRVEKNAVVLEGRMGPQRFSTRLFVRDLEGFMRALGSP